MQKTLIMALCLLTWGCANSGYEHMPGVRAEMPTGSTMDPTDAAGDQGLSPEPVVVTEVTQPTVAPPTITVATQTAEPTVPATVDQTVPEAPTTDAVTATAVEVQTASVEVRDVEPRSETTLASSAEAVVFPRATRTFSGPEDFPPAEVAGYGIIAFPERPNATEASSARFMLFCNAWAAGFETSQNLVARNVPRQEQMITVMPLDTGAAALAAREATLNTTPKPCEIALENYGLIEALTALARARLAAARTDNVERMDKRGPYLLAWSPGARFTDQDALVLVADLTNSTTEEQIAADMRDWRDEIQKKPELWRTGWSADGLRVTLQRWFDRHAEQALKLLGGGKK